MHMHATPCDGTSQGTLIRKCLCGAVQAGDGVARHFRVAQPRTHSIFMFLSSYLMSWQTAATGGS